jgi:hypothetical protein
MSSEICDASRYKIATAENTWWDFLFHKVGCPIHIVPTEMCRASAVSDVTDYTSWEDDGRSFGQENSSCLRPTPKPNVRRRVHKTPDTGPHLWAR